MDRRRLILTSLGALGGTLLSRSPTWADICFGDPCQCANCSWCVNGHLVVPCPVPQSILPLASDMVALRSEIGSFRSQLNLPYYDWSRLIAPGTTINSRDLIELRVALNGIYAALGLPGISWDPGPIWAAGPQGWIAAMNQVGRLTRTAESVAFRAVRYVFDWRGQCPPTCWPARSLGTLPDSAVSFASGYTTTAEFTEALAHAIILAGITTDLIAMTGAAPRTVAAAISTTIEAAAVVLPATPLTALGALAYYLRVGSLAATIAVLPPAIEIFLTGAALAAVGLSLYRLYLNVTPGPWPAYYQNTTYPAPPIGAAATDLELELMWGPAGSQSINEWFFDIDW